MKKSEAMVAIDELFDLTYEIDASITLVNDESGRVVHPDMPTTLAVIRATLAFCMNLLASDDDSECRKRMQALLKYVGLYIAHIASHESE